MKIRLAGDKIQKIKVDKPFLAFLEIVGNRRGNVIIIDPLKMLYIAYESIRFRELLDKLYMLEAEICSRILPKYINKVPDILEKSTIALTESITALNRKLLAKVEVPDKMRELPQEVIVKVTHTDLEVAGIGYEELLFTEGAELTIEDFIMRIAWALIKHEVPLNVIKTIREKFDHYEQKILK